MAEALARAGQIADGLAISRRRSRDPSVTKNAGALPSCCASKASFFCCRDAPGAATAAEDHFQQALGWARRQGALSWELRAATSLARLLRDQNRSTEAIALLAPIYNRFTEGFETADLKAAKALIDGLYNSKETTQSPLMDAPPKASAFAELSPGTARRRLA